MVVAPPVPELHDFRALVERAPYVVAIFDRELRVAFVNRAWEETAGVAAGAILGRGLDALGLSPERLAIWRDVLSAVRADGRTRTLELDHATDAGLRRHEARVARIESGVVVTARDVSDLRAMRVLDAAVRDLPIGMAVVEAPSGRVLFANDEGARIFGQPNRPIAAIDGYDVYRAYHPDGTRVAPDEWPIARAILHGERCELELAIERGDGARRVLRVSAAPVRDRDGAVIAGVSAYYDVTDVRRARERAAFLEAATLALAQSLDPAATFAALARVAVPRIADACAIHVEVGGRVEVVARAHREPPAADAACDDAIARVLAGGPAELVRAAGAGAAIVAPVRGRERVLAAITLVAADPARVYHDDELAMAVDLGHRAGLALEHASLYQREQQARRRAEEASERTRRLQRLTEALSIAIDAREVAATMVTAGREAFGAAASFVWLRDGDGDGATLELVAHEGLDDARALEAFRRIPLTTHLPVCEVVRTGRPLHFEDHDAMTSGFADAPRRTGNGAWAVLPLSARGRVIGAASLSFAQARRFSPDDRELLAAMAGQASIALGRAVAFAAERRARAEAEAAHDRAARLRTIASRLATASTPAEIETIVVDETVAALGALQGMIALRGDGDEIEIVRARGPIQPDSLRRIDRHPIDAALPVSEVVRTGRAIGFDTIADAIARFPLLGAIPRHPQLDAFIAVPLTTERATIGALAISWARPRALDAAGREFLDAVAGLTAQALERSRLYVELETSRDHLRLALSAAQMGTWRLDVRAGTDRRDATMNAILGLAAEPTTRPRDELFAQLHPDDRARVEAAMARALAQGGSYDEEARVVRPDGGERWTRHRGQAVRDARGVAVALTGVVVDTTEAHEASERAAAEARVREELYESARAADRRKDEFLAMLGHELRNPLAPIATALQIMRRKDPDAMRRERAVIERQVDHLTRLIDDLLDIGRITRGAVALDREPVAVREVLAKAIEMASPLLETRRIPLEVELADDVRVDGDPVRLAQVFQNLLTNAAKYSEPGSPIVITQRRDGGDVVIAVRDRGIGIPAELLPRVFDLFVQGPQAIDRASGGLGIGLTLVKTLVELHGGTVEATSDGPGRGSVFAVRLPARDDPAGAPRAIASAPAAAAAGRRVLIVDDNGDAAEMLADALRLLGHDVRTAPDGLRALDLSASFTPEVAILDIGLPVMDGYELAHRLRAAAAAPALLIALTGYGQAHDRARALAAGFDHHLIKPVGLDTLAELLR